MIQDRPSQPVPSEGNGAHAPGSNASIENLRQILFRSQIQKIEKLETEVDDLENTLHNNGVLIKLIAPVLGEAIRLKIREARDEMIEALYPIIGQVIRRAVSEAVSDLARSMDAQVKRSFNLRLAWWRLRARLGGASDAQIRLRELLPFTVTDIFLIHRESGLLLFHLPGRLSTTSDHDLVSGMLTAIHDFARDTLGQGDQTGLGEIEYGDQHILIETTQHATLAVMVNGIEPPGFRAEMRDQIIKIEHTFADALQNYQGNPELFSSAGDILNPLLVTSQPEGMSTGQKRLLAGALSVLLIFLVGSCLFANWIWKRVRTTPAALPVVVQMTPTPTLTATSTSTLTATATLTNTPSPTVTLTSTPAPLLGVMLGNVWLHQSPSFDETHLAITLAQGEKVEILAQYGDWYRVRWVSTESSEVTGWVPTTWVGITTSVPALLITPTISP